MNEAKDQEVTKDEKKTLSLGGTLSLKAAAVPVGPATSHVRQSLSQGRGKTVSVEVRRRRGPAPLPEKPVEETVHAEMDARTSELHQLTTEEREARIRALIEADEESKRRKQQELENAQKEGAAAPTIEHISAEDLARQREIDELNRIEEEERRRRDLASTPLPDPDSAHRAAAHKPKAFLDADEEEEETYRSRIKRQHNARTPAPRKTAEETDGRRSKLTVTQVLNEDYEKDRGPSLAAVRRAREKARKVSGGTFVEPAQKASREIVVPEAITVQELANRMAERGGDVVKALMRMGVMATITQVVDADTAELLIHEFGHKIKRVTEQDIEEGLIGTEDRPEDLLPRPPVVTIMGHVDHGKTSLLDSLRSTDVVSGEAGGITQHIGAYQVTMKDGEKITFLDTPGHAAFSEMRARGANITDIVVLVVAANDSIMPQTIEAINHAKAAKVPLIVAVNKIDLHDANPQKVKQDLLSHEVVVEDMGGETLCIEVSAKKKMNLEKLVEAILLQAEVLDLKANPSRVATGTVVEARLEQGRGNVATVLIQNGTLKIGDLFVIGAEWGRVRALMDDRGHAIQKAIPGQPVEVLGLNGAPDAGDSFTVVDDEAKARNISEFRQRKKRESASVKRFGAPTSLEQMLAAAKAGAKKELPVVIKADVHGSVEAIVGSLRKFEEESDEVAVRVLHAGVGGITESDVTLAHASGGIIIGFNVRAGAQARALAERDGVDIRYYNIIYNVIDDAKAILSGMLSPTVREVYLGQAAIRQVFNITKVGKVAGCMVTQGVVKRGSRVRLLRDNVVIHEGVLKTLKRMKDEVKEVKEGMECGMAFENYDDVKENDVIECFDVVSEARSLA